MIYTAHFHPGRVAQFTRLIQKEQEVQLLKGGIQILSRAIEEKVEDNEWLTVYAKGLSLLDDYDHEQLDAKGLTAKAANYSTIGAYFEVVDQMKFEFDSAVFAKKKDNSFQSSLSQVAKGFGEKDFYPTLEENIQEPIIGHSKSGTSATSVEP